MDEQIALRIPPELYRKLQQVAEITRRPLEAVALQALSNNLPDLPPHLPKQMRERLNQLNDLTDEALWEVMMERMNTAEQTLYSELQHKNRGVDVWSEGQSYVAFLRRPLGNSAPPLRHADD